MKEKNKSNLETIINNEIGMATLIASGHIKTHNHPFYEINYILQGNLNHELNGIKRSLTTGEGYIFNLNDTHSYTASEKNQVYIRNILISVDLFNEISELFPTLEEIKKCTDEKAKYIKLNQNEIFELESLLYTFSITLDTNLKKLLAVNIISKLYIKFFFKDSQTNKDDSKPYLLKLILDDLNKNCFIQNGVKSIVTDIGYSFSYVCKYFKKHMGITMTDYLKDMRLNKAAYLLKNTNMSLTEIIDDIGIISLSYFNKIFKEKFGLSPAKYRKINIL